jgi:hypothetical protein
VGNTWTEETSAAAGSSDEIFDEHMPKNPSREGQITADVMNVMQLVRAQKIPQSNWSLRD